MTSPVALTITPAGPIAPDYATVYAYLVAKFQSIYGADAWAGDDSQDGQWIGIIAQAFADCNAAGVAVYNAFSPTTAQGTGLASNVKLNGLQKIQGSYSTAQWTINGQANSPISNGAVQDSNGVLWSLPALVTIPSSGTIVITATCQTLGAISPGAGTTTIATPTYGWQSAVPVNNSAALGNAVETDAELRVRQANSVALPSTTILAGIAASIAQVLGVTRVAAYENNGNAPNSNGVPANTLAFVVEGGAPLPIQQAIALKTVGIGTYATGAGAQSTTITDSAGYSKLVAFMQAGAGAPNGTFATIGVEITISTLNGWASTTSAQISAAVAAVINTTGIGGVVNVAQLIQAALLAGTPQVGTYLLKSLQINSNGGAYQSTDITLAWNIGPVSSAGNVVVAT
jgi:hypothetical protein